MLVNVGSGGGAAAAPAAGGAPATGGTAPEAAKEEEKKEEGKDCACYCDLYLHLLQRRKSPTRTWVSGCSTRWVVEWGKNVLCPEGEVSKAILAYPIAIFMATKGHFLVYTLICFACCEKQSAYRNFPL